MLENLHDKLIAVSTHGDEEAFTHLQSHLDEMDQVIDASGKLSAAQVQHLVELFKSPWWGGYEYGYNATAQAEDTDNPEAPTSKNTKDQRQLVNVQLARHYINGQGQPYAANLHLFRTSAVVSDTINALKKHICELIGKHLPANVVRSSDPDFLHSNHAESVMKARQNVADRGLIFNDGTMTLDQSDPRISNHNHRFKIHASTSKINEHLVTRWRVEGQFGFNIQGVEDSYSELPIGKSHRLKIPNRVAHQLTKQGDAQKFMYFADWSERYMLFPIKTNSTSPFSGINM